MSKQVFANDLPIVTQSGEASSTAFPDVCMSPPGPPIGPLPLPYPSSAKGSDLTNGSRTVVAGGKPIMLKDASFLAKTTGDEGATRSYGAALVTGQIQGKAYPQSASPNVKIEGKSVVRSLDLVTHNHAGEAPGNTPPAPIVVSG